jgi:hypothetical protein
LKTSARPQPVRKAGLPNIGFLQAQPVTRDACAQQSLVDDCSGLTWAVARRSLTEGDLTAIAIQCAKVLSAGHAEPKRHVALGSPF